MFKKILQFNKETWISQNTYCYAARYSSTRMYYFNSLVDALWDVYEERMRLKLTKKQSESLEEVIEKIQESQDSMKAFIKKEVSKIKKTDLL